MMTLLCATLVMGQVPASPRSFTTGHYRNLFQEIGKTGPEIQAKLDSAWKQMFYGDDRRQRVYFPVGDDMAYIKDVGSNDVRTEGMSYGMMLAVQFGHREEFDRLWRWASMYMRHKTGPYQGFFAWQCDTSGRVKGDVPASDGEEYFAMSLFFAAGRWGNTGTIKYREEADSILHAMLHRPQSAGASPPMFNLKRKMIVFCPTGDAATFTDASYHLPAFYELWARWAKEDRPFWKAAAGVSREYFPKALHPKTGLPTDYSSFDGKPFKAPWDTNSLGDTFASDSFRVIGNIAMDYAWFGVDAKQPELCQRMLSFFSSQTGNYFSGFNPDGKPLVNYQSAGHAAMNAVGGLAVPPAQARPFVEALWNAPVPSGQWRYYDGMLYMFSILHASGNYRIWAPSK